MEISMAVKGSAHRSYVSSSVHRQMPDLGVLLWHAFGAVSSLLQEVLTVYLRDDVSDAEAARVINALDLLESIAEHPRTK